MTSPIDTTITTLDTRGVIPAALSGQLLGIVVDGDHTIVHSVELEAGRAASYRSRRFATDVAASGVVVFGGSTLVVGDGSIAHELTPDLDALRPVDLAGQSQAVSSAKRDTVAGDLHVVAVAADGSQSHVVVSSSGFTRRSRTLLGIDSRVSDLEISNDHVVFTADARVAIAPRDGDAAVSWITTGVHAPVLVGARDVDDTVVVLTLTPALERWTLDAASASVRREVLDRAPRRCARTNDQLGDVASRFVWTTGNSTVTRCDLVSATRVDHNFHPAEPGHFAFVTDAARAHDADGGWLVAFVHHTSAGVTDLVVLDAAAVSHPPVVTIRIPRPIPQGLHTTWIPSTRN